MFDFNVANDTSEAIALYRLTFWVATSSDIAVATVHLQAQLSDETTYKTVSADDGGTEVDGDTWYKYHTIALTDKDNTSRTLTPYLIAAGKTARFQLVAGTVTGAGDGTKDEYLSTYMLGDTATSTAANVAELDAAAYASNDQGNFVWSDLWSSDSTHYGADPNATSTVAQWWNGYLVPGLQSTSTVQTLYE